MAEDLLVVGVCPEAKGNLVPKPLILKSSNFLMTAIKKISGVQRWCFWHGMGSFLGRRRFSSLFVYDENKDARIVSRYSSSMACSCLHVEHLPAIVAEITHALQATDSSHLSTRSYKGQDCSTWQSHGIQLWRIHLLSTVCRLHKRQVTLQREVHLPNSSMSQQLLRVPPQQLLQHLRLEFDLYRIKILQPTLGRDEGVV